ncbi:GDSL esterase/lipase [Dorcoceras hygrometricum]|nr:GDSL esterase/lipase [Dorcoceras hygrometricum]
MRSLLLLACPPLAPSSWNSPGQTESRKRTTNRRSTLTIRWGGGCFPPHWPQYSTLELCSVKRAWVRTVLGWVTSWEVLVRQAAEVAPLDLVGHVGCKSVMPDLNG